AKLRDASLHPFGVRTRVPGGRSDRRPASAARLVVAKVRSDILAHSRCFCRDGAITVRRFSLRAFPAPRACLSSRRARRLEANMAIRFFFSFSNEGMESAGTGPGRYSLSLRCGGEAP